jgi:hypothetical protein
LDVRFSPKAIDFQWRISTRSDRSRPMRYSLVAAAQRERYANTQRIRAVVADGRLYRRADLDQVLAGVK